MDLVSWAKKELHRYVMQRSKRVLSRQISVKSLKFTPISSTLEVELEADFKCVDCLNRVVAETILKVDDLESIVVHVLDKKVSQVSKPKAIQ